MSASAPQLRPAFLLAVLVGGAASQGAGVAQGVPWNYDPTSGDGPHRWASQQLECMPSQWSAQCAAYTFAECAGQSQSPVDIDSRAATAKPPAFLHFVTGVGSRVDAEGQRYTYDKLHNNGKGVELEVLNAELQLVTSMFRDPYVLTRILHKMPAEHTLDGVRHDLEQQYVFLPADALSADAAARPWTTEPHEVRVSLMYTTDRSRARRIAEPATPTIVEQLRGHVRRLKRSGDALYLFKIEPQVDLAHGSVYVYEGSDTAPPCRERVTWILSDSVRAVDAGSLADLLDGQSEVSRPPHGNSRPVGALRSRAVVRRAVRQPSRATEFHELAARASLSADALGGADARPNVTAATVYAAKPASDRKRLRQSLKDAVTGLVIGLVVSVALLVMVSLVKHEVVPLTIVPSWMGGTADPEREQWAPQNRQIFGTFKPMHAYGDIEEEMTDEEDEEDLEDDDEEDVEEDSDE